MRIIRPGGSGQIGGILARHFHANGDMVTVLSRTAVLSRSPRPAPWQTIHWDGLTRGAWIDELGNCDVCINLAGRSVNCRYGAKNPRPLSEYRTETTLLLNQV